MTITAVIGAQFGSEGKGKISAYLAPLIQHAVRTGGPNAGHTVKNKRTTYIFRHLPCASVNLDTQLYLAAGAIIDPSVLEQELKMFPTARKRLVISPLAAVITPQDYALERTIREKIGSTAKGVGAALVKKILRDGTGLLARDVPELSKYIGDVTVRLCEACYSGEKIMLEGTQGAGLSLHHGHYPFVTSRDVTTGSLCGEAGLPPTHLKEIVLVVRPFPIRVAGNSGPLPHEISWEEVRKISGAPHSLKEHTTVTGLTRRVGKFDLNQVIMAAKINGATSIALTFADHLNFEAFGVIQYSQLPLEVTKFIGYLEDKVDLRVDLVSTGPYTDQIVDRRLVV